jgi:hypothetical protein
MTTKAKEPPEPAPDPDATPAIVDAPLPDDVNDSGESTLDDMVLNELVALREQVEALTARVATLEGRATAPQRVAGPKFLMSEGARLDAIEQEREARAHGGARHEGVSTDDVAALNPAQ